MTGWIKLHRQITENEFYFSERFTKAQAWIDMLLLANHSPNTIYIRGNEVALQRGELAHSMVTLAKRWGWNERTVNKFLSMLENRGMIQSRKNAITTVISINNYIFYQGKENDTEQSTEQNTERSTSRIQTDKNDKNEKEKRSIPAQQNAPAPLPFSNAQTAEDMFNVIQDQNLERNSALRSIHAELWGRRYGGKIYPEQPNDRKIIKNLLSKHCTWKIVKNMVEFFNDESIYHDTQEYRISLFADLINSYDTPAKDREPILLTDAIIWRRERMAMHA